MIQTQNASFHPGPLILGFFQDGAKSEKKADKKGEAKAAAAPAEAKAAAEADQASG